MIATAQRMNSIQNSISANFLQLSISKKTNWQCCKKTGKCKFCHWNSYWVRELQGVGKKNCPIPLLAWVFIVASVVSNRDESKYLSSVQRQTQLLFVFHSEFRNFLNLRAIFTEQPVQGTDPDGEGRGRLKKWSACKKRKLKIIVVFNLIRVA